MEFRDKDFYKCPTHNETMEPYNIVLKIFYCRKCKMAYIYKEKEGHYTEAKNLIVEDEADKT